jgi:predicted nucleic acid-binding protein
VIFLLDTTAFSDLMREDASTQRTLASLAPDDRVAICSVVRGEVRYGIERLPLGKRREALETKASRLFTAILCEPVPPAAGDHYGRIKADIRHKGLALDENDLWIAASASAIGATLVSRDTDFRRVHGLALTDWSKSAP